MMKSFILAATSIAYILSTSIFIANAKPSKIKQALSISSQNLSCTTKKKLSYKQLDSTVNNNISTADVRSICDFINEFYKNINSAPSPVAACNRARQEDRKAIQDFREVESLTVKVLNTTSVNVELTETIRPYVGKCKKEFSNEDMFSRHTDREKMDTFDWEPAPRITSKRTSFFSLYRDNASSMKWKLNRAASSIY